jgi:hypothetical protein
LFLHFSSFPLILYQFLHLLRSFFFHVSQVGFLACTCACACHLPPAACRLPPATCRLPPAACRLPPTACRLPPATCRLPPAACRLPPVFTSHVTSVQHRVTLFPPPSAFNFIFYFIVLVFYSLSFGCYFPLFQTLVFLLSPGPELGCLPRISTRVRLFYCLTVLLCIYLSTTCFTTFLFFYLLTLLI